MSSMFVSMRRRRRSTTSASPSQRRRMLGRSAGSRPPAPPPPAATDTGGAGRRGQAPVLPLGRAGAGFMQPQGHVRVVVGLVDDGLDPQAAVDVDGADLV